MAILCKVVGCSSRCENHHDRVNVRQVIRCKDDPTFARNMMFTSNSQTQQETERWPEGQAQEVVKQEARWFVSRRWNQPMFTQRFPRSDHFLVCIHASRLANGVFMLLS